MFDYEKIKSYNELEMLVYNYIIEHKQEVKYMTIRELAEAVHVSTATIIRFCKKNDCEGYSEFRTKFKMYLSGEKKKKPQDGIDEVMNFFQSVSNPAFQSNLSVIAEIVRNASQLIFVGIGTSGCLGKYAARYFSNYGKYSQFIEDPYYPIASDLENSVVIALSVSGETPEVIRLVEHFKFHNCKLVSITNKASSTLAKMSDYNLSYYVTEHLVKEEYNVTTQIPVIYLLETIGRMIA